jgi:hypothetical protein
MMLLSPAALALFSILAVIGLLYWLRMPRRTVRLPFSGVAKSILPPATRLKRQSRTLLSFALQALILACIVFAAAKPIISSAASTGRSVIVVLDLSASMLADDGVEYRKLSDEEAMPVNTPVRFNKAIAALRSTVQGLGVSDKLMLIAARRSATIEFNMESDTALMDRQIQKLAPCAESANLEAACMLAASTARSLDSCEVVVITDGAFDTEDLNPLANCGTKATVRCIKTGETTAGNLGITSFHARKNIDSPSDYEALVTIFNTFDKAQKIEVELLFDGKVCGISEEFEVPARGEASYVFKEKLRIGGVLEVRLRVADALSVDNSASEILLPSQRLRLLVVSTDPDKNSCVRVAIGCNATGVEPKAVTPEIYTSTVKANGAASLSEQFDAVLFDCWMPQDLKDLPGCNMMFFNCIPQSLLTSVTEKSETTQPLIRKWDRGHPLMSGDLKMRNIFMSKAKIWELSRERNKSGPQIEEVCTLVASPLILASEREIKDPPATSRIQRIVCVGFDPRTSDIKMRKELPLLIWNSLAWFHTDTEPPTQTSAGAAIELPLQPSQDAAMTVVNPDGASETIPVGGGSNRVVYADTAVAGIYQYHAGKLQGRFAVNVGSRRESDLSSAANFPTFVSTASADDSSAQGTARRLWPSLLIAGLVLLVIEAILFHRRVWF